MEQISGYIRASLAAPVVLVSGVRMLDHLCAATLLILLLPAFQAFLLTGLHAANVVLPPPRPLRPLYVVAVAVMDSR